MTLMSFAFSPYLYAGTIQNCVDGAKKILENAGGTLQISNEMQSQITSAVGSQFTDSTVNQGAAGLRDTAKKVGDINVTTAAHYDELMNKCAETCDPSKAVDETKPQPNGTQDEAQIQKNIGQQCIDQIEPLKNKFLQAGGDAYDASKQAGLTEEVTRQGSKDNGGMSPMMAGLLGAALGGAAGFMAGKEMEKRDQEKDKDKDKDDDKDVVQDDGTVDCTAAGAEAYSDCNEYFENKCASALDSEECQNFSARYCSASGTANADSGGHNAPATSDTGVIIASAADKDIQGEGVGTQFCFVSLASSFCKVAGRETCPSCLQLETNKADVCESNPVLCLAQNNPVDIESAKETCPSDPMFSNPDYIAGGGATVPNSDGLPDPILPADGETAAGGDAGDVAGGGGDSLESDSGDDNGSSGLQFTSADKVVGSSGSFIGGTASDVAGNGRVHSNSESQPARHPTAAGEVMGPSLFSMSSAMIESRCKQHQLAHCSK